MVEGNPVIAVQPQSMSACVGGAVTLQCTAASPLFVSYQWRKDGVAISGANENSLTIDPVGLSHSGAYDVVVGNGCGVVISEEALLSVSTGPAIALSPIDHEAYYLSPTTFAVVANGGSLSYQWRKDGAAIVGATESTLTIPHVVVADEGSYDVVIGNECGTITSDAAELTVSRKLFHRNRQPR
jgi:hypothetical protein